MRVLLGLLIVILSTTIAIAQPPVPGGYIFSSPVTFTQLVTFTGGTTGLNLNAFVSPTITGTVSGSATYSTVTLTNPTITGTVGGSATYSSITMTAPVVTNNISIGTTPATTGAIRLANNTGIVTRNSVNTVDINTIISDNQNITNVNGGTGGLLLSSASGGNLTLSNGSGTNIVVPTGAPVLEPTADGSVPLGATANRWSNLFLSGTIQNGTIIQGITEKTGSGAGNYTTTSATYVNVDGANLTLTQTVSTGWKDHCVAMVSVDTTSLGATMGLAIADGGVVKREQTMTQAVASDFASMAVQYVVPGDGASHVITLQWKVSAGTGTMANSTATLLPNMVCTLMPSN